MTDHTEEFYTDLFTRNQDWSLPYPNPDEADRVSSIFPMLSRIARTYYQTHRDPLRIIDVGCGRGWLTSLLAVYGSAVGIDPVGAVVEHATRLFPHLDFYVATPEKHPTSLSGFFDVAVCSEVIEHIQYGTQKQFLLDISTLVKADGDIILTTPRGELFKSWQEFGDRSRMQPVEAWLSETELDHLVEECGLRVVKRDRCHHLGFKLHTSAFFQRRPFRWLFKKLGYTSGTEWNSKIYQVVWLKKQLGVDNGA